MANENRASFFVVGLTVMLGLVAMVGTLIYIGGLRDGGDEVLVETYYDKPVSGLSHGSVVNFRGVKVGEVRQIGFVGNEYEVEGLDNSRIYILMALDTKLFCAPGEERTAVEANLRTLVEHGLRATVAANGITGLAKIECDFDASATTPPQTSWMPRHICVPPKASLLESFSESATKVMNQINRMDLNAFWSNINASVESVSAMTLSSQHLLESYQPELERMVKNLEEASGSLKVFSETLQRDPSSLLRGNDPAALPETAR